MKNNLHKNTKDELIEEILNLRDKNKELDDKVKDLEGKLNKNNKTSSKPSSTEGYKKNTTVCNSRKKGQNPRGGKVGHKGSNLKRIDTVDEVIDLTPENCENCGANLIKNFSKFVNKKTRQIIDMYTPSMSVKDYTIYEVKCNDCGFLNKPAFPEWISKPVQYGRELKAFSSYMYNYQMPSYERLQDFYKEVLGLNISQTSLCNFNKTGYDYLESFEEKLKETLVKQELLHADETGVRVDGKLGWIHVISNQHLTFLGYHKKRGKEAINSIGILNNFLGNCVTDYWRSYIGYKFIHYLCNAHHLRELSWIIENEKKKWAEEFIKLLMKAKKLKDNAISENKLSLGDEQLENIHIQYKNILQKGKLEYTTPKRKKGQRGRLKKDKGLNLIERFQKHKSWILGFVDDFSIPFDNNLAERDLRMVKTRTKVSGCFRSEEGTEWFCRTRSYISTLKKQSLDIYPALQSIYNGNVILPKF